MGIALVQSNTGSFNATSGSATLPTGTTAGSMVLLCAAIFGTDVTEDYSLDPPAGFDWVSGDAVSSGSPRANRPYIWIKRNTSAESSWTLTPLKTGSSGFARDVVWAVFEVAGTGLDRIGASITTASAGSARFGAVSTIAVAGTDTAVTSRSTGNTESSACYDTLTFAVHAATSANTTVPTITNHMNGFVEVASVSRVGTKAIAMSVSTKGSAALGPQACTATISPSSATYACAVTLYADGARYAPDLPAFTGFEFGTATSIATGSILLAGSAPFDSVVGSPAVVTTSPRSGTYCLELSASAAAECLTWGVTGGTVMGPYMPTNDTPLVFRFCVYFPTSLPSGDVELASFEAGSLANGGVLWYRSASQKLGVVLGTGTEVLSDATVAADSWIGVDGRFDPRFTNHLCDWAVDYDASISDTTGPVPQAQAVGASTSVANANLFRLGWSTAKTATVRYDDVACSKAWGAYPINDIRVTVVEPDQAGTPTVSGTATNFKTFTGGPAGTLTTWSAATTRSALATGPPPVVGATGVGLVQVSVAASDYVEVPMGTFTAAPDYVLRAVRWYAAGAAASTASATLRLVVVDTAGTLVNEILLGHHGLDATTLRWLCLPHTMNYSGGTGYYEITQARMDALKIRIGYSTDATPDLGVYSVFCEVAYQPVVTWGVIGEAGDLQATLTVDPVTGAVTSATLNTAPTLGATLRWVSLSGGAGSQPVAAAGSFTQAFPAALDSSEVTSIEVESDPELADRE